MSGRNFGCWILGFLSRLNSLECFSGLARAKSTLFCRLFPSKSLSVSDLPRGNSLGTRAHYSLHRASLLVHDYYSLLAQDPEPMTMLQF